MTTEPTLSEIARSIDRDRLETREDLRELTAKVADKLDVNLYNLQMSQVQKELDRRDQRDKELADKIRATERNLLSKIETLEKRDEDRKKTRYTTMIGPVFTGLIVGVALIALQLWLSLK